MLEKIFFDAQRRGQLQGPQSWTFSTPPPPNVSTWLRGTFYNLLFKNVYCLQFSTHLNVLCFMLKGNKS